MKKNILLALLVLVLYTPSLFAQVPSYVPTNDLVGYWPFSGNANDESGNGNNGVVNGATLTTDRFGNTNKAYQFDRNSIRLLNSPQFNGNWSVSLWYKRSGYSTGYQNYGVLFSTSSQIQFNGVGIWLLINEVKLYFQSFGQNELTVQPFPYDTNWHHLVYTFNGTTISAYVDSVLRASGPITISQTHTNPFNIGRGFDDFGNDFSFIGKIDDFGIWNRALTVDEIVGLYNAENTCQSLVINTGLLSFNPPTYTNSLTIYPNPANDQITIDCGNLASVSGWAIKISNMLGQEVFTAPMNTQQYVVPLNTWSGQGIYFVRIYDAQNNLVNTKKIILQ